MHGLLSLVPWLILLLLWLMHGLLLLVPRLILLLLSLMLLLPLLIQRANFTVALVASAAIAVSTLPVLAATSGFEASGQGMAAVGPVQAAVELFHTDGVTLPVT